MGPEMLEHVAAFRMACHFTESGVVDEVEYDEQTTRGPHRGVVVDVPQTANDEERCAHAGHARSVQCAASEEGHHFPSVRACTGIRREDPQPQEIIVPMMNIEFKTFQTSDDLGARDGLHTMLSEKTTDVDMPAVTKNCTPCMFCHDTGG